MEYLVLNGEGNARIYAGIPIKKSSAITPEKALHLSFLITDYWSTAKKVIQSDLKMHDNPIENIRMRTTKQKEIIILQSYSILLSTQTTTPRSIWCRTASERRKKSQPMTRRRPRSNDSSAHLSHPLLYNTILITL